jgi:CheY-like chemotaxis protein
MILQNIILITAEQNPNFTEYLNKFESHNVITIENFYRNTDDKGVFHEQDSVYDNICKIIDSEIYKNCEGILIDLNLYDNVIGKDAVSIIHHLRLHKFKINSSFNNIPIIIINDEPIVVSDSKYSGFTDYGLLKSNGAAFQCYDTVFKIDSFTNKPNVYSLISRFNKKFDFNNYLNEILIPQPKTSNNHQTSNEWGAVKLAINAGYNIADINYKFPPTLYFKYLLKKNPLISDEKLKENFGGKFINSNILLIDDNAHKGWQVVLETIFKSTITSVKSVEEVFTIENYNQYDLVFLDLYLPNSTKDGGVLDKESSLIILEGLKKQYPQVPIIIFTASNKSWTLDEILELGADGMYVKESPEYSFDIEYSKNNFENFKKTVIKTTTNYKILRPYWTSISDVLNSPGFNKIHEKKYKKIETKIKERIKERLEMFYGLLKRGMEQRKYNKEMFHFSDYELAFMTLWSTLNEISELNYDKIDKETSFILFDLQGKQYVCKPKPGYNWKLINTDKYLIKYDFGFQKILENGTPEKYNNNNNNNIALKEINFKTFISRSNESYVLSEDTRKEYTKEIAPQIAFIILNSVVLEDVKKQEFCSNLFHLNNIRNKLYLTHGDKVIEGFFNCTEKEKRGDSSSKIKAQYKINPQENIKDLFEIVMFLLRGEISSLNIE